MPSFPTTPKTFTTKNTNDVIAAAHVNDIQDEVNAIETGYLNASARLNSSASTLASLSVTGGSTIAGELIARRGPFKIWDVTQSTGATFGLKLADAHTNAASSGAILDCRGFDSTQSMSTTVQITKPVTILFGHTNIAFDSTGYLWIRAAGVRVLGAGQGGNAGEGRTVFDNEGTTVTMEIGQVSTIVNSVLVDGIDFVGTSNAGSAIRMARVQDSVIRNCRVYTHLKAGTEAIRIAFNSSVANSGCFFNAIQNCRIDNCNQGIAIVGSTGDNGCNLNWISDCNIASIQGSSAAILIDGRAGINHVVGCGLESNLGTDILIRGENEGNTIERCHFEGTSHDYSIRIA